MDFWITPHYPRPLEFHVPWNVYFKTARRTIPSEGDEIFFYETGMPQPDRELRGEKSIVCLATVAGPLVPKTGIEPWVWQMACTNHRRGRIVPLDEIREVVHGPFYRQAIRRISKDQYTRLVKLMELR